MNQRIGKDKAGTGIMEHDTINSLLTQLNSEAQKLLTKDNQSLKTIDDLNFQLETLKTAYKEVKSDAGRMKDEIDMLKRYSRQVICLLDGDGAIFLPDIIALGNEGGRQAASMLRDAIQEKLSSLGQFQLWVYVFYNHGGLASALGKSGYLDAKRAFHEFVCGFNQASERFIMVDVGYGKEAADAKVKAHLEDDIRAPQVSKIVFGGCHDDSYATTINSLVTHGLRDKLLLLRGYTKMAPSMEALRLPSMSASHLFLPEKLVSDSDATSQPVRAVSVTSARPSSPLDFKTALKTAPASPNVRRSPPADPLKRVPDPNKPLSKHNPPPCTLFYLAENCKWGASCQYSHHYLLQEEHYAELRAGARKSPCPFKNKNEPCPFGENCVYGHTCPHGSYCYYAKTGSCRFAGDGMHSTAPSN